MSGIKSATLKIGFPAKHSGVHNSARSKPVAVRSFSEESATGVATGVATGAGMRDV